MKVASIEDPNKYAQFGNKYLHYQKLLNGFLSIYSRQKRPTQKRVLPISSSLKMVFLDTIHDNFDPKKYSEMSEADQELFDETCKFAGIRNLAVIRAMKSTDQHRDEMFKRYEILKGEVLAGSDSRETLKKMRNLLMEMREKRYIPASMYNSLILEVLACL